MRQELAETIAATIHQVYGVQTTVVLTEPDEQFGDFATNVALQLAKQLAKQPREIAEALVPPLSSTLSEQVSAIVVAGPGFLNLTLRDSALAQQLKAGPAQTFAGKQVVTEYSDPNPFKVLHAGHLYTTIVGDVVSNLLVTAGAHVHRLNFGGDVGLHVGKTMWAIIEAFGGEHPEKLATVDEHGRLEWLSERYIAGNRAYEDDPAAKSAIVSCNKRVYELFANDDHDSPFAQLYWTCRTWSYAGFERLYEQLQVAPFERYLPESEVQATGTTIVKDGLRRGIFVHSDGAVIYQGEKEGLHSRVFLNSQGLPTYEAKDLGLAATKWQDYAFDLNIIITSSEQTEYMRVVLAALRHLYPVAAARTKHLTHGVIKLAGGVKMSSRKGNFLRADDVLIAAREAQTAATGTANEQAVLGAIKYAFLKQRIGGDIIYDPAESVSILGNSGPYLQYAHARACSILKKATLQPATDFGEALEPDERNLVRKIAGYAAAVDRAVAELLPHHICTYLYELAQTFNRFYEHNQVVGDPRQATRLYLVARYTETLSSGLALLGISAPETM